MSLAATTAAVGSQTARTGTPPPAAAQAVTPLAFPLVTAAPSRSALVSASLQLPALLAQHSVLVADMTRGRLRSDPDLAQATNAALGKNTAQLAGLVRALFGDAAASQFSQLWAGHVSAYFNYARGLSEGDPAVRTEAMAAITRFETQIAQFFSAASGGRLTRAAVEAVVRVHLEHLLHQADTYSAGNYTQANLDYREAYVQGFGMGKTLAGALLPASVAAVMKTPAWQLTSELDRLLGEHVVLVVAGMRAGATNSPDFAPIATSIDGNTTDLAGAVATLFGTAAAKQFQSLWADHVDALISYSAAIAKGDSTQRVAARAKLSTFERGFGAFLTGATRNRMVSGSVTKTLGEHDQMLISQAEAFVGKDYTRSHDLAYTAYQEMIGLATTMADAFRLTLGARLPLGAVEAGRGGLAAVVEHR